MPPTLPHQNTLKSITDKDPDGQGRTQTLVLWQFTIALGCSSPRCWAALQKGRFFFPGEEVGGVAHRCFTGRRLTQKASAQQAALAGLAPLQPRG